MLTSATATTDWNWDRRGDSIVLDGLTATMPTRKKITPQLITGGPTMEEGIHYWEVRVSGYYDPFFTGLIGVARPGLDHNQGNHDEDGAYYISSSGSHYGGGKWNADVQEDLIQQGDRIGCLLDLCAGSLRFYRNGAPYGLGFPAGSMAGPLVRAVELRSAGDSVNALPEAIPEVCMLGDDVGTSHDDEPCSTKKARVC